MHILTAVYIGSFIIHFYIHSAGKVKQPATNQAFPAVLRAYVIL